MYGFWCSVKQNYICLLNHNGILLTLSEKNFSSYERPNTSRFFFAHPVGRYTELIQSAVRQYPTDSFDLKTSELNHENMVRRKKSNSQRNGDSDDDNGEMTGSCKQANPTVYC